MNSFRRVGWRYESHRHYLAAKGVKTKFQPIKYKKAPSNVAYDYSGVDSKGRIVRLYSDEHKQEVAKEKFERVRKLKEKYPAILREIQQDTESPDERERANARVAYIIAKTGLRPGTRKDTKGDVEAFGVTTLRKDQVSVAGNTVEFDFVGKKGVEIEKTVEDARMAKIIQEQKREAGDELFPHTSDATVRNYLEKHGDFKTKDFRTLRANWIAAQLRKKGEADKVIVSKVADDLHNTPGVSKSAYIDPALMGRK